jgi:hypothetical protein
MASRIRIIRGSRASISRRLAEPTTFGEQQNQHFLKEPEPEYTEESRTGILKGRKVAFS